MNIGNMSLEELLALHNAVVKQIKTLQNNKQYEAGRQLTFGDKVSFTNEYGQKIEGEVLKVNLKSVKVHTSQGTLNVLPSLLTKV